MNNQTILKNAIKAYDEKDWAQAKELLIPLNNESFQPETILFLLGNIECQLENFSDSLKYLEILEQLQHEPISVLRLLILCYDRLGDRNNVNSRFRRLTQLTELSPSEIDLYSQTLMKQGRWAESDNIIEMYSKTCAYRGYSQETFFSKDRPHIFINTLPKSGSVYIQNSLAKGLDLKLVYGTEISGGAFPDQMLVQKTGYRFLGSGVVMQNHIPANKMNLALLCQYYPKLVLHVRDPRQALISWTHHTIKDWDAWNFQVYKHTLELPQNYLDLNLSKKFDIMINKWFPLMLGWLENWKQALVQNRFELDILVTRQEDLKENKKDFFQKILTFYDIPFEKLKLPHGPVEGKQHFRKGSTNEWQEVLTSKQINKLNNNCPPSLFEYFNWSI